MAKPKTIDALLFDIARELDYLSPTKWSSATLRAQRERGRYFTPEITFKSTNDIDVHCLAWHDIPGHLMDLAKIIGTTMARVESFSARMTPDGHFSLKAFDCNGKECNGGEWRYTLSREGVASCAQSNPERMNAAADVFGVPPVFVPLLQQLNQVLRTSIHPLTPPHEIPVKFWNIKDRVILYSALQYFPSYASLAQIDQAGFTGLPAGYLTAYRLFASLSELENEGLATAIGNLGADFYCDVIAAYRAVGLSEVADLYQSAMDAYMGDREDVSKNFQRLEKRIRRTVETEKCTEQLCKYFSRRDLFEQR